MGPAHSPLNAAESPVCLWGTAQTPKGPGGFQQPLPTHTRGATTRVTFWAVLTLLLLIKIAARVTAKLDRGQPGWQHTRSPF